MLGNMINAMCDLSDKYAESGKTEARKAVQECISIYHARYKKMQEERMSLTPEGIEQLFSDSLGSNFEVCDIGGGERVYTLTRCRDIHTFTDLEALIKYICFHYRSGEQYEDGYSVISINVETREIREYKTNLEAAQTVGTAEESVGKCIRGELKTTKGHMFMSRSDFDKKMKTETFRKWLKGEE